MSTTTVATPAANARTPIQVYPWFTEMYLSPVMNQIVSSHGEYLDTIDEGDTLKSCNFPLFRSAPGFIDMFPNHSEVFMVIQLDTPRDTTCDFCLMTSPQLYFVLPTAKNLDKVDLPGAASELTHDSCLNLCAGCLIHHFKDVTRTMRNFDDGAGMVFFCPYYTIFNYNVFDAFDKYNDRFTRDRWAPMVFPTPLPIHNGYWVSSCGSNF